MPAVKVSVSIDEGQLRWLRGLAKKQRTTLSSVVSQAVADLRRSRARERLIERLGGRVRISNRRAAEIRAEWEED